MADFNKLTSRVVLSLTVGLSLGSVGCLTSFNDGKTRNMVEANPVRLDAEQVMLSPGQVECGLQNELWESPAANTGDRVTARLTAKGKALKFDDDVSVIENGYRSPYAQVRGEFPLGVIEITNTKDGPETYTKLVELKVGVKIDHVCFPNPLPIMGLRHGQFSQDASPVILFRLDGGWQLDRFVH